MSEKFNPQPGDVVEVNDHSENWHTRIFIEMGSNGHYGCFWDGDISVEAMAQRVNGPFPWRYARPAIPVFGTPLTRTRAKKIEPKRRCPECHAKMTDMTSKRLRCYKCGFRCSSDYARKPLSDLQQQWLERCPEFDTDKYEYEIDSIAEHGDACWVSWHGKREWKTIAKGASCAFLRRPKTPTFKLGDKFSFEGKNCRYILLHESDVYPHARLNLDNMTVEDAWDTYTNFCAFNQSAIRGEG